MPREGFGKFSARTTFLCFGTVLPVDIRGGCENLQPVVIVPIQLPESYPKAGGSFATTQWTVVRAAQQPDSPEGEAALECLCRAYWSPLYGYVRRAGYDPIESQDLTQEFFTRLIEKRYLARLTHTNGRFRSFLLTFLKHFLSDHRKRHLAMKRGGGRTLLALDDSRGCGEHSIPEPIEEFGPEEAYEQRWVQTLLERALNRLCAEYAAQGKGELFERLKDCQPGHRGETSYAELAHRFGLTESGVKSAVHRLRRRYQQIIRQEVALTVSGAGEVDDEIRHLIAVLGRSNH